MYLLLRMNTIYFLKCDNFDAIRSEYLNTWYQSGDSLQNFHNIISTINPVLIKQMCIYC